MRDNADLTSALSSSIVCDVQRSNAQFRGSSKYASVYTHQNKDQGRRDDLWSLFYLLVEFLDGILPWTEVRPIPSTLFNAC